LWKIAVKIPVNRHYYSLLCETFSNMEVLNARPNKKGLRLVLRVGEERWGWTPLARPNRGSVRLGASEIDAPVPI